MESRVADGPGRPLPSVEGPKLCDEGSSRRQSCEGPRRTMRLHLTRAFEEAFEKFMTKVLQATRWSAFVSEDPQIDTVAQ